MNDDIKQAILAAYEEGFTAGVEHSHYCDEPPYIIAWLRSDARKSAGMPPLTPAQLASVNAWEQTQNITKREALDFTGVEL